MGDYVYIRDSSNSNHYYIGVSPLQIFAGASDLAGFYGLQTPGDPELHWKVLNLLQQKNYKEVGNILKQQNIGYVIVNHEPVPEGGSFVLEQFDFVKSQNEQYKQAILGEKIRDFGKRYSLYRINPEFSSPTVFTTSGPVTFQRDADSVYNIWPFSVAKATSLVLMEPYSRLWTLERLDGYKHETVRGVSSLAYGYGNKWSMDPAKLGSPTVYLRAEFWPNKVIIPSLVFSLASGIIAGVYCVVTWTKKSS